MCEPRPARRHRPNHSPHLLNAALCYADYYHWPVFPIWEKGRKIGVNKMQCQCGHRNKLHGGPYSKESTPMQCNWYAADTGIYCVCEAFTGADILTTGKQPATRNGFKDATDDAARIRAWWERHPNCNIGVPTGVRFDVIDIDLPDGPESYAQMIDDGLIPDVHGQVDTASGGRHLYIEPTGDGCTTRLQPGIDYRGVGGFVVVPPSVLDGSSWRWVTYPSPVIMGGKQ